MQVLEDHKSVFAIFFKQIYLTGFDNYRIKNDNMELAMAFASEIKGIEDITLLSAGTDGADDPTDAAGSIGDVGTCNRGETSGLDVKAYLADNDS